MSSPCPSNHRLTRKKTISPKDLRQEKLIMCPRDTAPGLYEDILSVFRKENIIPDIVQEAPEQLTIAGLVASGMGCAVVPECMMNIKVPGVVHRPFAGGRNMTGIALVVKKRRSVLVENFIRLTS